MLGLLYLHKNGIIHRDIKGFSTHGFGLFVHFAGANILVSTKGQVKLADFGCSKDITGLGLVRSGLTIPNVQSQEN